MSDQDYEERSLKPPPTTMKDKFPSVYQIAIDRHHRPIYSGTSRRTAAITYRACASMVARGFGIYAGAVISAFRDGLTVTPEELYAPALPPPEIPCMEEVGRLREENRQLRDELHHYQEQNPRK